MGKPDQKPGRLFFLFIVISVIILPIIIFKAFSVDTGEALAKINNTPVSDFDHKARQLFGTYNGTTPDYMEGSSTSRTLNYYYSLRQYPGSPPYIPHDLTDKKNNKYECLSCHERGGFTRSMNRFTPVTPHPQNTSCRQCHVKPVTDKLFKENEWVSIMPPRLGRSALPGSPPPIPHALQMRENCIACHVGPGAVIPIRVEHPMRGNCRQCHVPQTTYKLFTRTPR